MCTVDFVIFEILLHFVGNIFFLGGGSKKAVSKVLLFFGYYRLPGISIIANNFINLKLQFSQIIKNSF